MGLFSKIFKREDVAPQIATEKGALYAPITGNYIPLEQIPDAVFSQGILGQGCGVEPEEGIVVAPVNGTVTQVAETKHAIGITTEEGAELLIHIGMDTVEMSGDGFSVRVKEGDKVSCGQTLVIFDMDKIKAAGHPATTAFVVTNSDEFPDLQFTTGMQFEKTEKIGKLA